jgi:hypothetical protein
MGAVYTPPAVCGKASNPKWVTIIVLSNNKFQQFIMRKPFSQTLDSMDNVSGSVE